MNAIDNSNLLGYNKNYDYSAFLPKLTYTYNSATKIIVVTDASTFPAGNVFKSVNVLVHDTLGNTVGDNIAAAAGNTGNIDVSSLNPVNGLTITGVVVTDKGWTANGSIKNIVAAGELANWNKGESAAEAAYVAP